MSKARRIALTGVLTGSAMVAFMLENLLPPLFLPGARLGLANVFSLAALVLLSPVEAIAIVTVRTVLGSLLVGNPAAIAYSLTAGLFAMGVSAALVYAVKRVSLVCVSVTAGAVHNTVQTLVFCLVTGTPFMLSLLPYLVLLGAGAGAVTGLAVYLFIKKAPLKTLTAVSA
jgi:heptaprenyl diphosphate synthase